jgi:type 1 glutamine amidotransferase
MRFSFLRTASLALLCGCIAFAQAKPIRVAIFRSVGTGGFVHGSIQPGATAMTNILRNPGTANIGTGYYVPPDGILVASVGVAGVGTNDDVTALMAALDTNDVIVWMSNVAIANLVTNAVNRQKLANFMITKGGVGFHGSTDSRPSVWNVWDTIMGATFTTHSAVMLATMKRDSLPVNTTSPAFLAIQSGVPDTMRFSDEWYSFSGTSAAIRAKSGLHVLNTLNENSFTPNPKMGDHPITWYREFSAGGRLYYTAAGHENSTYNSVAGMRRQAYNAVMWAAKAIPDTVVGIRATKAPGNASDYSKLWISGSSLTVEVLQDGGHNVDLLGLDGSRLASQQGNGHVSHTFNDVRPGTYALALSTAAGRSYRLVTLR